MTKHSRYRHELKYEISYSDYLSVRQRLRHVMNPDSHTDNNGHYLIRSIYFDSIGDKALKEKLYGVCDREKFRIRYYNDDLSYIILEKKMKRSDLCMKIDAVITESECRRLLDNDILWMLHHHEPLVRELYVKMVNEQLRPKVVVSYIREPYIYAAGNVRVTFDSCIRTSLHSRSFLDPKRHDIIATDTHDTMIMEVKYDDFLPDIIAQLIQTKNSRQQAFSKYGTCRRFC